MNRYTTSALAASAFLLAGCLVPERFTARVEVQPDAGYTYSYSGTALHALAAYELKKVGRLAPGDEAALKAEADKMRKNADVREATYKGEARYQLAIEGRKKAGESTRLMGVLNVSTGQDGVMTIASGQVTEKARKDWRQLGVSIDGKLVVKLPKNAEVISHNANSVPRFFGLFGDYSWKIGNIDQRPEIKIRFRQ